MRSVIAFFESNHCKSQAHCVKCRDKEGGSVWRSKLVGSFGDVAERDFDCPRGKPWSEPKKVAVTSHFKGLYDEITAESNDEWLLAMAEQCKAMYDKPPVGMTCKNKRLFRNRWYNKLKYYRQTANSASVDNQAYI